MSEYSISGPFCGNLDPLYGEAVQAVRSANRGSISTVQRVLRIGYNRAATMIEAMEKDGIVSAPSPVNGSRSVLKDTGPKPSDGGSDGG